MNTWTKENVENILAIDIDRTYRGATGCACGCGGNYYDATDEKNAAEVARRIKYVLRGIKNGKAEFFGNGVEVANPSYTRVTRIYFKDGVDYDVYASGRIERSVKVGA